MQNDNIQSSTIQHSYSNVLSNQNNFSRNSTRYSELDIASTRYSEVNILSDHDSKLSTQSLLESTSTERRLVNHDESSSSKDNHYNIYNTVENEKTKSNDLYLPENAPRSIDTVEHTKELCIDICIVNDNNDHTSEFKFQPQSIRGSKYFGRKHRRLSYSHTVEYIKHSSSTSALQENKNFDENQQNNKRRVSFNDEKLESIRIISEYSDSETILVKKKKKKTKKDKENDHEKQSYLWYENVSILTIFYTFVLCILFYGVVINRDNNEKESKIASNDSNISHSLFLDLKDDKKKAESEHDKQAVKNSIKDENSAHTKLINSAFPENKKTNETPVKNENSSKKSSSNDNPKKEVAQTTYPYQKTIILKEVYSMQVNEDLSFFEEANTPELKFEFNSQYMSMMLSSLEEKIKDFESFKHLELEDVLFFYKGKLIDTHQNLDEVIRNDDPNPVFHVHAFIDWKVGDECMIKYNKDSNYYKASKYPGHQLQNFRRSGIILSIREDTKTAQFLVAEEKDSYPKKPILEIKLMYLRRVYESEKATRTPSQVKTVCLTENKQLIQKICTSRNIQGEDKNKMIKYAGKCGKISGIIKGRSGLKLNDFSNLTIFDIPLCLLNDLIQKVVLRDAMPVISGPLGDIAFQYDEQSLDITIEKLKQIVTSVGKEAGKKLVGTEVTFYFKSENKDIILYDKFKTLRDYEYTTDDIIFFKY